MKKRKTILFLLLCLLFLFYLLWGNTALEVSTHTISSPRIPAEFSGFRIAQISDLHNAEFGEGNALLLEKLSQCHPDVIFLTGDLVDSRSTDIPLALSFAESATEIAPVYYVTGNHEARIFQYSTLKAGLEERGVSVLDNQKVILQKEDSHITLLGIDDPSFLTDYLFGDSTAVTAEALSALHSPEGGYTVLLAHRPELLETYADSGIDLVFSGHAHGGQFRLPFLGGMFAPNQGFFPKYDGGLYTSGHTHMLVSRGIGNSLIPFRINNPPEILVAELFHQG